MSLFSKINQIFRRTQPVEPSTQMDFPAGYEEDSLYRRFTAESERTRIVQACRKMYAEDPRAKKMLRTLARDMTKGGYTLRVKGHPEAQAVADRLYKRLKITQLLDDWVRLTARDGDSFLEAVVNDALEIVEVTRKPTLMMRRNSNLNDQFEDPGRAYWMSERAVQGLDVNVIPQGAVVFADWQMIHARWEHDEGRRYGTPMMASGISAYRKVTEGELDIAVRRKTRAGMRFLHVLEGAQKSDIETYKAENKAALSSDAARSDFFSNRTGSLSAVQGDAHLSEIDDVRHHIQTWMTSGEVPMELIAYGEDLNRDVLGEKQKEYRESLEQLREWVTAELVRPLLERQWLLAGIYPEGLDYQVIWKTQAAVTAQDILAVADAAMRLRLMGLPDELIWNVMARYLPGVDAELLDKTVAGTADDPARYASILAGFSGFA